MSALAMKLDQRLLSLPPDQSAALEKQVAALLQTTEPAPVERDANGWPVGHWERIHALWGDEPFERPDQGVEEIREDW
jgi:hypothetical protein